MEKTLLKIANTLILNTGTVLKSGLLEGKMGIALYLFYYSQLNGNKSYHDFAVELLNEISNELSKDTISVTFLYGLTGVAWCINHLIENKFIEADEDILEDIDVSLKNISQSDFLTDIEKECPFCSKGIYFTEKNDKETVNNILNVLSMQLSQNTGALPLSYLNSIMYMLLCGCDNPGIRNSLINIIYLKMVDSIKNKQYTFPDALLLTNLVEQFIQIRDTYFDCKEWEILLKQLDYDNLAGIFNIGIYDLIFNRVKSNRSFILSKLETMDIELEINSIVNDVGRNPNLYNGLAGAGLTLINYFGE